MERINDSDDSDTVRKTLVELDDSTSLKPLIYTVNDGDTLPDIIEEEDNAGSAAEDDNIANAKNKRNSMTLSLPSLFKAMGRRRSDSSPRSKSGRPKTYRKASTGTIIKKFYDYRPQDHIDYFTKPPLRTPAEPSDGLIHKSNSSSNLMQSQPPNSVQTPSPAPDDVKIVINPELPPKAGHAVVIPFFNEESYELQQTLNSLYQAHIQLQLKSEKWKNQPMYVCLIQDGWHKASESMKKYLKSMFNAKIKKTHWWDYFPELVEEGKGDPNATFVIEKKNYAPVNINCQEKFKADPCHMIITLVIKANNRRKHNSHEWFLSKTGFAEAVNAEHLFLTDAFTLYADNCLYYLSTDLDNNEKLSGVTGRQRLMTREQQGSTESIFSFSYILRMLQLFDFELANAVYNGAFSLGGLLPVIPGPCGMYRAKDLLQDRIRNAYFDVVNEEPSNTGLILGNLRIAEDRILTYYAITKAEEEKHLGFNPLALFYFEAETDLQRFILQRRRWINGSVAGYLYLLFQKFSDFRQWNASAIRKFYIWVLLMFQFIIYCMVAIVPGITAKALYYGIEYFMDYYDFYDETALVLILVAVMMIYVAHVTVHHYNKFNYIIMYTVVLVSLATSLISYGSILHYAFIASNDSLVVIFRDASPVLYLAVSVFFCPFISAVLLSGRIHSLMLMIKSVIQYMLFIPLLVGWFGSYAYSRVWDLSWGNRPANELNDITEEQKKIMVTKFKEQSVIIILCLIAANFGVFFIPLEGQLYLMATFFCIALLQMAFSFVYCLTKIPYKCGMIINHFRKSKTNVSELVIGPADGDVNLDTFTTESGGKNDCSSDTVINCGTIDSSSPAVV